MGKLEAPEGSGVELDDDGNVTGSAGDVARYHIAQGDIPAAIRVLADKIDPPKTDRADKGGKA